MSNRYAVIMAGGKGERFWPLSTSKHPKQLLALVGDKPLIAQAVDRLDGLIPPENVFVVTHADLVKATQQAAPMLPPENVVGEPIGRDTAAAVACGGALVAARDPDGVFAVLTADQVMGDLDVFKATLSGGMDLAVGAKKVIVALEHTDKNGSPKIVKKCTYPLTAKNCVNTIITDVAVIEVTENGLVLKEYAPGWTAEEIQAVTEPKLIVADDFKEIDLE